MGRRLSRKTYYTGVPCRNGHDCHRYDNGKCVECHRATVMRHYRKNQETASARRKAYYWSDPERARQATKEWTTNNKERKRAYGKMYAQTDKFKKSCTIHRHRRRARLRIASGNFTKKDIARLHNKQKRRCYYCGKKYKKKFHIDHYVPLARKGSNWPSNLRITCPRCNLSKGAKLPWIFIPQSNRRIMLETKVDAPLTTRTIRALENLGWI